MKKTLIIILMVSMALGFAYAGAGASADGGSECKSAGRFLVPPGSKVLQAGEVMIVETRVLNDEKRLVSTEIDCECQDAGNCWERYNVAGGYVYCADGGCDDCNMVIMK